jgi:hypothetical protein
MRLKTATFRILDIGLLAYASSGGVEEGEEVLW